MRTRLNINVSCQKIKPKKKRNDQLLLGKEHNVYKLKVIVHERNSKCEDAGGWYLCIIIQFAVNGSRQVNG